jgi:energy-coupling factor transport system ATP-binding protein
MTLILKDVEFTYPEQTTPAINAMSVRIEDGECVLVIGPSGSGKTTLLLTMAGIVPHHTGGTFQGSVFLNQIDVISTPQHVKGVIGMILQDTEAQLVSMNVEGEIAFGPENLCLPRGEIQKRLEWAIQKARLAGKEQSFVYALSGGQKQRVAMAAGLAMHPKVLLLDGPTTNLDPMGAREVLEMIKEVRSANLSETIVIAANRVDEFLSIATRIIVVNNGEIVLDGTPEQVILDNIELLTSLGLFVPDIGVIYAALQTRNQHQGSRFPTTVEAAAKALSHLQLGEVTPAPEPKKNPGIPVINVANVSFAYNNGPLVLTNLSLVVSAGESLAVLGQNGCGKTTLMKLIAGLQKPNGGTVLISGKNTIKHPPLGIVGYVFQNPEHQFVTHTVVAELRLSLSRQGLTLEEIEVRVAETLAQFDLVSVRDASPYSLSVGQKRRLSVATMAIMRPKVLILDEPTTGLDQRRTTQLMNIVHGLVEKGTTLIQVTHDMDQVALFARRVVVIEDGTIVFDGTPRGLFQQSNLLRQTKLEAPPAARLARLLWPTRVPPITVSEFLEATHAT